MRTVKIIHWSGLAAYSIGLFWAIYGLIAGRVPVVTTVKLTPSYDYALPFGISRWWDILFGPVWLVIFMLAERRAKADNDRKFISGQIFALIGLGAGIGIIRDTADLNFILWIGAFGGLFGIMQYGLNFGLAYCLSLGLGFGLIVGLGPGLLISLVLGLPILGLPILIQSVARRIHEANSRVFFK